MGWQWGSVADWVTGLVTAGTLIATVKVASRQQREINRRIEERHAALLRSLDWLELRHAESLRTYYYAASAGSSEAHQFINLPSLPNLDRIDEALRQISPEELPDARAVDRLHRLLHRVQQTMDAFDRARAFPAPTGAQVAQLHTYWAPHYAEARLTTERLQPILRGQPLDPAVDETLKVEPALLARVIARLRGALRP